MIGGEGKGEKSNIQVNVVLNGYLGVREKFKLKNLPFVLLVRWRGSRGFCTGSVIRCNGFTFRFHHSGRVFYVFRLRDGIWNANGRTVSRLSTMIHGVISLFSVHRGERRGEEIRVPNLIESPLRSRGINQRRAFILEREKISRHRLLDITDPGYRV